MSKTDNGEFRGQAKADIGHLQADVADIKTRVCRMEKQVSEIHEEVTKLKTEARIAGAGAALVITIFATILIRVLFP